MKRKKEIEDIAREVLTDHGLLDIPVDPIEVARALGVKVVSASFSDNEISGLVSKSHGKQAIYLNARDAVVRQRFTIAHELGHLLLHMQDEDEIEITDTRINFRAAEKLTPDLRWTDQRRMEWEANIFAAALLMDESLVRRATGEQSFRVADLALDFQVSAQAMEIRLDSLGIWEEGA